MVFLPELALEAASNIAAVDLPSPGSAEVIKMTFELALESSRPTRIERTASLKCERGSLTTLSKGDNRKRRGLSVATPKE